MSPLQWIALAGVLGSGAIGGVFLAFSSFVMPALRRIPAEQGINAMQTINVTVFHPTMMGPFFGTFLLSIGAVVFAALNLDEPGALALAAGGALYAVGTFLLTGFCNVPLNKRLETASADDAEGLAFWQHYLTRWTTWNHVRTVAALLATTAFALALV